MPQITLIVRAAVTATQLGGLFAAAHPARFAPSLAGSLSWVCAWREGRLVGFVSVTGDGRQRAFLSGPAVHPAERRRGLGRRLVLVAAAQARAAGAAWLHADHDPEYGGFYRRCGFGPDGVLALRPERVVTPSPPVPVTGGGPTLLAGGPARSTPGPA